MKKQVGISALVLIFTTHVFASGGYEKNSLWSGRFAGLAGAGVSAATGAEALYFNPAGLAGGAAGGNVVFNLSPTFQRFSGPITVSGTSVDSGRPLTPIFGLLASYKLTENLGVGAGLYVGGGATAKFSDVDFTGFDSHFTTFKPTEKAELGVAEFSTGIGYEVLPHLKVGAAWRVLKANANVGLVKPAVTAAGNTAFAFQLDNLSATKYNGYRLGVNYVEETWGVGASYRSSVDFAAKGTIAGQVAHVATGYAASSGTGGDVTVSTVLPEQITLGGFYDVIPKTLKLLGEFAWAHYTKASALGIDGGVTFAALSGATVTPTVNQFWQNMVNLRLAAEYTAADWVYRGGYGYTSKVTASGAALPVFSAPGPDHSFVVGVGKQVTSAIQLNGAFEYSMASATTVASDQVLYGDYKTNAYAFHAGIDYTF